MSRRGAALLLPILLAAAEGGPLPNEMDLGLFPYEPIYFAVDPGTDERPFNAKFQFSLAMRFFDPAPERDARDGLYLAYSQTSLWDLESESRPFYDSSYRPEAWWHLGFADRGGFSGLGVQPGIGHESNGRSGVESRSINHAFLRLVGQWEDGDGLVLYAMPRGRVYLEKADNPEIAEYRGYFDLTAGLRHRDGFGLTATGRIGEDADKGSMQLEATYPIEAMTGGRMHGFLYAQWFAGWSETLLSYDQKTDQPRFLLGYGLIR